MRHSAGPFARQYRYRVLGVAVEPFHPDIQFRHQYVGSCSLWGSSTQLRIVTNTVFLLQVSSMSGTGAQVPVQEKGGKQQSGEEKDGKQQSGEVEEKNQGESSKSEPAEKRLKPSEGSGPLQPCTCMCYSDAPLERLVFDAEQVASDVPEIPCACRRCPGSQGERCKEMTNVLALVVFGVALCEDCREHRQQ